MLKSLSAMNPPEGAPDDADVLEKLIAPKTTSEALVVVNAGGAAVVDVPVPFVCPSAAEAEATPDHSVRLIASGFDVPDAKLAVTLVTDEAFRRYQSSIRVFEPVNDPVGPLVQVPPAESVTVLIGPVLAAWTAIAATSTSPVVVAGMLTVSEPTLAEELAVAWR